MNNLRRLGCLRFVWGRKFGNLFKSEAMEALEIVIDIEEMSRAAYKSGVPVDHSRFEKLSKVMNPTLETTKSGALVFFSSLIIDLTEDEESETGSNPSREEVKNIQGKKKRVKEKNIKKMQKI